MPIRKTRPIDMIFCLPGDKFSGKFLQCWTRTLIHCMTHNINSYLIQMYSSNIYHVRECFIANQVIAPTKNIKPFGGKLYDYCMWIDSDQVWNPEDIEALIARNVDFVGGAIRVGEQKQYAFGWYGEELKEKNELKRLTVSEMEGKKALIDVDFLGLAFTLIKFGVLEKVKFPWFTPLPYNVHKESADKIGTQGEDLSLCTQLKEKGVKLHIDPQVKIGHEKPHVWK